MVAGRSEGALHVLVEGSWHIGGQVLRTNVHLAIRQNMKDCLVIRHL